MTPETEELTGDALSARAAELDIEGRSGMTADELRDAISDAEAGGSDEDNANRRDNTPDDPSWVKPANDVGVDMLPAAEPDSEPTGPEDAAGPGPKRGDYEDRVLPSLHAHEIVATEDGGEPIYDDDGNFVDYKPNSVAVAQAPRFADQGEVAGKKGGVDTDESDLDEVDDEE
jgi:hypothetical protein